MNFLVSTRFQIFQFFLVVQGKTLSFKSIGPLRLVRRVAISHCSSDYIFSRYGKVDPLLPVSNKWNWNAMLKT